MAKQLNESDLLLPLERQRIHGTFKEYFKAKRNNFIATIHRFPKLWGTFQFLDTVWSRETDDLQHLIEARQILPSLFFQHAHLKFRVAIEMAFSLCLAEAWAILRVGIESAAYGHKIYRDPSLAKVWIEQLEGEAQRRAYRKAFEEDKKTSLYPPEHGLARLYDYWQTCSELGSHASVSGLMSRLRQVETTEQVIWHLDYFELEPKDVVLNLYSFLDAGREVERVFFDLFRVRFSLDTELAHRRGQFEREYKALTRVVLRKYGHAISEELHSQTKPGF